jgi:hypothetical protein
LGDKILISGDAEMEEASSLEENQGQNSDGTCSSLPREVSRSTVEQAQLRIVLFDLDFSETSTCKKQVAEPERQLRRFNGSCCSLFEAIDRFSSLFAQLQSSNNGGNLRMFSKSQGHWNFTKRGEMKASRRIDGSATFT